jgi:hypothetical protein
MNMQRGGGQLHAFLISILDGHKPSASRSGYLTPAEREVGRNLAVVRSEHRSFCGETSLYTDW